MVYMVSSVYLQFLSKKKFKTMKKYTVLVRMKVVFHFCHMLL